MCGSRRVLLVDHHDSFVHNLGRYFELLGCRVTITRPAGLPSISLLRESFHLVILSPGPCSPQNVPGSIRLVRELAGTLPILGICLGHQIIAEAFGGTTVRARDPVHGRATTVWHDEKKEFLGIPNPFLAGRYHSLIVDPHSVRGDLEVSAWTDDQIPMGIRHRHYPIVGWQFHPESILTPLGLDLLRQFLVTWSEAPG